MRPERRQNLVQSLLWFAASYGLAILGYLAVNALTARLLGPESFGFFVAISTGALVAGQISLVGMHRSGLREAARIESRDDPVLPQLRDDVAAVERNSLLTLSLSAAVLVSLLGPGETAHRLWLGAATAALMTASAEQQLASSFLRGFGRTRLAGLLEGRSGGALVAVSQAVALGVLFLVDGRGGLPAAVGALAVGYAVPTLLSRLMVARYWRGLPRTRHGIRRRFVTIVRRDWKFVVITATTLINTHVDLWLASSLLSAHDSSAFSASWRLVSQLPVASLAVQVVFTPVVSRLWARGEIAALERLLRTGATLSTVALVAIALPVVLLPEPTVRLLYGPGFDDAARLLPVMTLAALIGVGTGMAATVLMMSGNEGVPAATKAVVVVLRVALGAAAAAMFGVTGLVVVTVLMAAVHNVPMVIFAYRRLGVSTLPTLRPSLAALRHTEG